MDRMAAADADIVLNHLSIMKLRRHRAVCDLRDSGVRLGLGCDNCAAAMCKCVQAMKSFV